MILGNIYLRISLCDFLGTDKSEQDSDRSSLTGILDQIV